MRKRQTTHPESRRYHHGDLRRALVLATLQLIKERGAMAFTLREVARRAGVSHSAPYRHFRSKEALLAEVAQEGFTALSDFMDRETAGVATPQERVVKRGIGYVKFALEHSAHYRVMFGLTFERGQYPRLDAAATRAFEGLVADIAAGQEAKIIMAADPVDLAYVAWALVHGLADLASAHQFGRLDTAGFQKLTQLATATLAQGLAR